jgi:esterase
MVLKIHISSSFSTIHFPFLPPSSVHYHSNKLSRMIITLEEHTISSLPLDSISTTPVQLPVADYTSKTFFTTGDSSSTSHGNSHGRHVDVTSTTSPPPVLLLHGLLGSKRNFASLGTSLSDLLVNKRPILALDLRNHGDNIDFRTDMSYEAMAMDVLAFLDAYNHKQVVLVGHSMGAKVASTLALLYPDRVAGLVVLDMAPVTYSNDDVAWKAVRDILHVLADLDITSCKTKRDVDLLLRPTIPDPALRAFVLTNLQQQPNVSSSSSASNTCSSHLSWKIPLTWMREELPTLAGFPEVTNSRQYEGDAFFIHGGQSKFVRNIHLSRIAALFPNHMLTTIRGSGHWVHAEAPDAVLTLLKRYLDR